MNRARLEAIDDALRGVLDASDGDVEMLEQAHIALGAYIRQLQLIPTEINTRIERRNMTPVEPDPVPDVPDTPDE